jgi:molybdate/tungstate transport system substrate-binding protein
MRPKEVDLIALLESGSVDYIFIYKSVAVQHSMKYLKLPDLINLGNPSLNDVYNSVSVQVAANSPDEKMAIKGEYINYSLAVLSNAVNKEGAVDFVAFILSREGLDILRKDGQDPVLPLITDQPEMIPGRLRKFLGTLNPESYHGEK